MRADEGQATLEHIAMLAVVVVVIAATLAAVTANAPLIGDRTARLVCMVLTVGQGDCGSVASAQEREPDEPCILGSQGDGIKLGASITFVKLGGNRVFAYEELSDGRFKVTQTSGGEVGATAGVGASTTFTVADNKVGVGATAGVSGSVTFQGGQEWVVDSREELDQLLSAENWDRVDTVANGMPVLGPLLTGGRRLVGVGETFPPPDRVFVAAGASAEGSAYAGAGTASADAQAGASNLLGFSYEPDGNGEKTFYFETTVDGSAYAGAAGGTDSVGAELEAEAKTLTSVTVDADGNIVSAKRSALSTGESSGLTNMIFGGDPSALTSDQIGTGTQWDAELQVESDADRDAVLSLLASTGINPLGIGVDDDPASLGDPLGTDFMDAVRDRGDLTRYQVDADTSTWFEGSGEVAAVAKLGLSGGYERTSMEASNHEYWNGYDFAARTNC